ncbi:MAG TPA: hypothetical protein VL134_10025 [Leptolyngbya sp.]|jgi:hypothetical protein|nr:hypothetical protein [Leptolyngbya sp.]
MKEPKTSPILAKATARLRGLKAIDPALDFGNDRNVTSLSLLTDKLQHQLDKHNDLIKSIEASRNDLKELEKQVSELSSQMLKGVEFMYGQDSPEYELAGGVKTSDRVRKSRITRLKSAADDRPMNNSKTA